MPRRRLLGETGDTLTEFALASTVFFMTIFGILEFGMAVWEYNTIADLAKEGVRRASVCGANTSLSRGTDCNVSNFVNGRGYGLSVSVSTTPSDSSTAAVGSDVAVTVSRTFAPLTSFVPLGTITLSSTARTSVAK